MPAPVTVRNAADAWTNQNAQSKNYGNKARIQLRTDTGDGKRGWLYFNKPWPPGATIISAKLRLWSGDTWAGSVTLTVQRAASKWSANRINWNNQPGVTGATAAINKNGAPAGTLWELDVTSLIQTVANGGAWYGFRIITNSGADNWLHSSQSSVGSRRPQLVVEWSTAPDEPDNLKPSGGRAVSLQKPLVSFDFNDDSGDQTLGAVQVKVGPTEDDVNDETSISFDSGEVPTTVPELDLSRGDLPGGVYAGMADGTDDWWKSRAKDGAGLWSAWSDAVQMFRFTKGALTITSPPADPNDFIWDPSPTVTWTFTGRVQESYQVLVSTPGDPDNILWDSGKITSTDTSLAIPFGILVDSTLEYRIRVRIWDTIDREDMTNDPSYVEATRDVTFNYDGAIDAHVTNLGAVSDIMLPVEHLTWDRTGAVLPTEWVIQRHDGDGVWKNIGNDLEANLSTGGSSYAFDDVAAAPYKPYTWRVIPIANGKMTSGNPTVTGSVRRLAPFLMRTDGTDAVCFLNPKRSRKSLDIQELHEPMSGPPVLVTQRLGGSAGSVEGRLTEDPMPGVSADEQLARFLRLRDDSGVPLTLYIANEALNVVAYNFQYDSITDTQGVSYLASFEWIEVPK